MQRLLLSILALFFIASPSFAQGSNAASALTVFDVDASQFPQMKARFFAFDTAGKPLQNAVSAQQILLRENGRERTVTSVVCPPSREIQPLSAVLTMDISGSMGGGRGKFSNLQLAQQAATAFVRALQLPPSECAVTSFNHISFINQDFSADQASLLAAVNALQPGGGTDYTEGLLNAPSGGIPIAKAGHNKRIVIFLTDGLGDGNEEAIVQAAKDGGIEIYCVAVGLPAPPILRNIARRTGGVCFENVNDFVRITQVYQAIVQLAHSRTPCEFTWQSDAQCDAEENTIAVRLRSEADTLSVPLTYAIPPAKRARLLVNPFSVRFYNTAPNTSRDTTITIRATGATFTVTNIVNTSTNTAFTVSPTNFTLRDGESRTLTLRFSPRDSSLSFARFEIQTNTCSALLYAGGGFPSAPVPQPTLRLVSPNGGEVFLAGADTVITWEGVLPTDTVRLQYSIDSGRTWRTITDTATGLRYKWRYVPNTPSERCLMRVSSNSTNERKIINLNTSKSQINSLNFSLDGKMLVTCFQDNFLTIWNAETGAAIKTLYSNRGLYVASFNSFGDKLITYETDGAPVNQTSYLKRWNLQQGIATDSLSYSGNLQASPSFSRNDKYILAAFDTEPFLLDAQVFTPLRTFFGHGNFIHSTQFAQGGSIILSSEISNSIRIWDTETARELRRLNTQQFKTMSVTSIDQSGSKIAVLWGVSFVRGNNGNIIAYSSNASILDADNGSVICFLRKKTSLPMQLYSGDWSGDASQFLLGTESGAYIMDANSGDVVAEYFTPATPEGVLEVSKVAMSDDMSKIALGGFGYAKIIVLPRFAQVSTSANVWSIISPTLIASTTQTQRVIDMGLAVVGRSKDSVVQAVVQNPSAFPVRVDSIRFVGDNAAEFGIQSGAPPFVLAAITSAAVEFRFSPKAAGLRTATVLVFTQNDTIRIPIQGTGVSVALTQSAQILDFGRVLLDANKDTTLTAIFRNTGGLPITIPAPRLGLPDTTQFAIRSFGVVGTNGALPSTVTPSTTLRPNDSAAITVRFLPSKLGRTSGVVQFSYGFQGMGGTLESLVLRLFGEGILQPLTAQSLVDMRTATVGAMKDSTIQAFVQNPNARAMPLDAIRFENTTNPAQALEFSCLTPLPANVPANGSAAVQFRFRPSVEGVRSAQMVIGAATQTLRSEIRGEGVSNRSATLSIPNLTARVGGTVQMPIYLQNRMGTVSVGATISATLQYDYALLVPVAPTPAGSVQARMRSIPLTLTINTTDERVPLTTLTFRAAYSPAITTALLLTNLSATPSMQLQQSPSRPTYTLLDVPRLAIASEGSSDAMLGENVATEQATAPRILAIQPNPATSAFVVRFFAGEQATVRLSVHNALSKTMQEMFVEGSTAECTISTASWAAGVYTVRLQTASGADVRRVIVVP